MKLPVMRLHPNAKLPTRAYEGDAGLDIYLPRDVLLEGPLARMDSEVILFPTLIPLGIAVEIPEGYEGQLRLRSSSPIKAHVAIPSGLGTIDSGYRGEIFGCVYALRPYVEIAAGYRLFQLVVSPVVCAEPVEVNALTPSVRGESGHGSSGR